MKYATIIRFNGNLRGRSVIVATYEAASVGDALEQAINAAVRSVRAGGSIFVTGVSVDEIPE